MKNFTVLIIILWLTSISSTVSAMSETNFSVSDVEWDVAVSGTLYRGNTLSNGEYTTKAMQFSSPVPGIKNMQGNIVPDDVVYQMVYLNIYKNGVFIRETIMDMTNGPYIDPDYDVKITVTGFLKRNAKEWVYEYYNPWASISIQTRAKPKLEVEIITDKAIYTSHDDNIISAKVKIINSGGAFAKNVDVNLNIGELKLRGGDISQLHQYYSRIDKNSVQSFRVILVVPELIDEKSYGLIVDTKGYDVKDIAYGITSSSSVIITPEQNYLMISKALRDRIYLDDIENVKITVANGGIYDIYNISVTDSMNENFVLGPNMSLQWHIPLLKPGQEWYKTYSIKPMKADLNGFRMPEATAKFTVNNKPYSASSGMTTVVVNGPIIILNKTVNKNVVAIGEDVIVTVTINNVGNIPTKVEVKDSLPDGVYLVSGQTFLDPTFLELNTPQRFSYAIRNIGDDDVTVSLSAAIAHYTDIVYRGTRWSNISSNNLTVDFKSLDSINSTNKNLTGKTTTDTLIPISKIPFGISGIMAIIAVIIILILVFIYLRR